jgi:hypothetical protein
MDAANARMIESRCGMGFAEKAFAGRRVFLHVGRKEFQGDLSMKRCVVGKEHFAHATLAQPADDTIMRDALADHGGFLRNSLTAI